MKVHLEDGIDVRGHIEHQRGERKRRDELQPAAAHAGGEERPAPGAFGRGAGG
ncbi:MAG TPA: hypothetical protein VFX94_00770 [Burkholderiales bacterium]|nr:hypothetical protein [Burkholderiales bacterium]